MKITAMNIIELYSILSFIMWIYTAVQMNDIRCKLDMIGHGFIFSSNLYYIGDLFLIFIRWFMSKIGILIENDIVYAVVYFFFVLIAYEIINEKCGS